jgi:chorismate mutase
MENVTISFETGNLNKNVEELLAIINKKDCVHKLEIIAQE